MYFNIFLYIFIYIFVIISVIKIIRFYIIYVKTKSISQHLTIRYFSFVEGNIHVYVKKATTFSVSGKVSKIVQAREDHCLLECLR